MKKNRGFSLIELIVIIAIMSILTGVLTPMFLKYADQKRQQACRQNREAILSIYEKSVYAMSLQVKQDDLDLLLQANDITGTMKEYSTQVQRYLMCPKEEKNNQFEGYIDGSKAYITCKCHADDVCMVDFAGWEGMPDEMLADKGFGNPGEGATPTVGPEPTLPPKGEGNTPPPSGQITSVWPHRFLENGELDPRWANAKSDGGTYVGITDTATVDIPLPKYAHFIDQSGKEFYIIQGNRDNALTVKYYLSDSPETMIQGYGTGDDLTWIIAMTGVHYDNANLKPSYDQDTKNAFKRIEDQYDNDMKEYQRKLDDIDSRKVSENWDQNRIDNEKRQAEEYKQQKVDEYTRNKAGVNAKYEFKKGDVISVYYDYVYKDNGDIDYAKSKKMNCVAVKDGNCAIPTGGSMTKYKDNKDGILYFLTPINEIDPKDWGL